MKERPDFDAVPERSGTGSEKWRCRSGADVVPLGVADMDFASPAAVGRALRDRVDHGIFGYTVPGPGLVEAVRAELRERSGWDVSPDWLVFLPGLVCALHAVCRLTEPGETVLTAVPVYPPFLTASGAMGRETAAAAMRVEAGRWIFDPEALETAAGRAGLFLLCNPHNPTGRVLDRAELETLAEFCLRRRLLICSDEIHCGLILDRDRPHVSIAALGPEVAERTVTLLSPSKTYNLAGIGCALAVVPDPELRRRFLAAVRGIVPHPGLFGLAAMEAAYRHGGPWREELLDYLRGNRDLVAAAVERIPGLACIPPQATYLAWVDARAWGWERPAERLRGFGVEVWDGSWFGVPGYFRVNFGCPRSLLSEGLRRIAAAVPEPCPPVS
ncbi:MAG TPA: PatB family C-S lyase [bacterium]|nr:PatB family C-S lyase [bacterium]HPQ66697.1 PatB family C-S lyase [bacterium]